MQRLQAYRFQLRPNAGQERKMRHFAGCCRFVFNRALAIQNHEREQTGVNQSGYVATAKMLTLWRQDIPWLAETPVHIAQPALRNLDAAWSRHFDSIKQLKRGQIKRDDLVGPPKFKKKHKTRASFRYPDPKQFRLEQQNNRMFLPKLGWIRYRNSRTAEGEIRNITVFRDGPHWFVSILTRREVAEPVHSSCSEVGIDVGIATFAAFSTGQRIEPVNAKRTHAHRLAHYQRKRARKKKFSQNWEKAKVQVAKLERKIAAVRNDFLHKQSTQIAQAHAVVYVEDLQIKNMSASAQGTAEKLGRNVQQKSGLNRSILDQGWGEFRRQLEYKLNWRGGELFAVAPQYTSQTCPNPQCGHVSKENRKSQAVFRCGKCGYSNHADVVGAINTLRAGQQARRACQANGAVRPSATGTRREAALCAAW